MAIKIEDTIVGFSLVPDTEAAQPSPANPAPRPPATNELAPDTFPLETMNEAMERQEELAGVTYKIKPPTLNHAVYVTINDIVLNEGTPYETRRPYEIFIQSKNMENAEWMVALTRVMSAVFRKGGNLTFLIEELQAIYSPQGGYLKPGGVFMPSVVAEFAAVIKRHLVRLGLMDADQLDEQQRAYLQQKIDQVANSKAAFAENAQLCMKCHYRTVALLDGCMTCMTCGDSKCD